jgi:hypothetical protein
VPPQHQPVVAGQRQRRTEVRVLQPRRRPALVAVQLQRVAHPQRPEQALARALRDRVVALAPPQEQLVAVSAQEAAGAAARERR